MTTLTFEINERSKKGKAFMQLAKTFMEDGKDIKIVKLKDKKVDDSTYNQDFVKKILKAKTEGNYTTVDVNDIWGSLGLK